MDKIQNIGSTIKITNNASSIKQHKPVLKYEMDSISFTGKKQAPQTIVGRVLSFFTAKREETNASFQNNSISDVWKNGDGVTPKDANSELACRLRSMQYITDTKTHSNVVRDMYDEAAIKTIVKYDKQDPEFAKKLAHYLRHANYSNSDDLELIAAQLKQNPEMVEKFYERTFESPYSLSLYLKAHQMDSDVATKVFDLTTNDGNPKYYSYDVYSLTKATGEIGKEPVLKYAADKRMKFYADDVIKLAQQDATNSKQINELIEFVTQNGIQEEARKARISALLKPFIDDVESTKVLMKNGVVNGELITQYTPALKDVPKQLLMILTKNHKDSRMGFGVYEVVPYAYKAKQYESEILQLAKTNLDDLCASQFKSLIDAAERSVEEIAKIVKNAI